MNAQKRALLLVGSPKGPKSTSESLGNYLLEQLHKRGLHTEKVRINTSLKSDKGQEELLLAVDISDLLILSFPLYVDSLPSSMIRAMELIAKHRKAIENPKKQQLLAISNCGFPEAHHNDTALAICRRFALESGLEWIGGLGLGGGAAIDGKPLNDLKGMVRNVKKSLDLTAAAIAEDKLVPKEAADLMAKPLISTWVYLLLGNFGWKRQAKKNSVLKEIHAQPY